MLGAAPSDLLDPVAELIRADFFVEDGEALTFRHDILREAVLESMPTSARRALERQAVNELLRSGAPPVEVAEQLAESAQPGDSEAIDILTRAAKALGASDPPAAAELAQRTLELIPREDPRRGPLVADVAVLLHAAGRPEEATSFADVALSELLPPEQESEVRYGIAGMFSLSPDVRAEAGRKALALSGLAPADRARHLARLVHNTIAAGRRTEAEELLGEAKDEIEAHGDEASVFSLGLATGGLLYTEGDFGGALERIEAAVRAGSVEGEEARARLAQQWRTEVLATVDRFDEAIPLAIARARIGAARLTGLGRPSVGAMARSPALPARRVLGRDRGARRDASTRGSTAELWLERCRRNQRARWLGDSRGRPGHWSWMCRVRGCSPGERNSGAQAPRGVDSGAAGRGVRRPGSRPADHG